MISNKNLKIAFIIGIALTIIGPIFGLTLDKVTIEDRETNNPLIISETSTSSIQDCYYKAVELSKNQRLFIEFSVYYQNISATLIILGKGTFDQYYAGDLAPPGSGLTFICSEFTYGEYVPNSVSAATSRTLSNEGYWYIEFAGGVDGVYLISRPGNYYVVVYGTNAGPLTEVSFNLKVKVDGPGAFLQTLFLTIGILVLICCALLFSYSYINTLRRGV